MDRPEAGEYHPYYDRYIGLVPDVDIVELLEDQIGEAEEFFDSIGEEKSLFCYAPGKWTIREVLGHVLDTERVFGYRALRFGRNDETPVKGFDQNAFVFNGRFNSRSLDELIKEFRAIRNSNLIFLKSLDSEAGRRSGSADGFKLSVRSIAYILAGHFIHHLSIIRNRYLVNK